MKFLSSSLVLGGLTDSPAGRLADNSSSISDLGSRAESNSFAVLSVSVVSRCRFSLSGDIMFSSSFIAASSPKASDGCSNSGGGVVGVLLVDKSSTWLSPDSFKFSKTLFWEVNSQGLAVVESDWLTTEVARLSGLDDVIGDVPSEDLSESDWLIDALRRFVIWLVAVIKELTRKFFGRFREEWEGTMFSLESKDSPLSIEDEGDTLLGLTCTGKIKLTGWLSSSKI